MVCPLTHPEVAKLTELLGIRENRDAPSIAKDYWRLEENATIRDVLYAVRSDETTHRFVNHSLGNLEPTDVNPFAIREPDMHTKGKSIEYALRSSRSTDRSLISCIIDSPARNQPSM